MWRRKSQNEAKITILLLPRGKIAEKWVIFGGDLGHLEACVFRFLAKVRLTCEVLGFLAIFQ